MAHEQHLVEEFVKSTAVIHGRADTLIHEIMTFDLMQEIPESIKFSEEDLKKLGIIVESTEFPVVASVIFKDTIEEIQTNAKAIMNYAKIASSPRSSISCSFQMLEATIPCVLAVKRLVVITKELTTQIRHNYAKEKRVVDVWRKQWLQDSHVKKLFQMWESQVLGDSGPSQKKHSNELSNEDVKVLEDPTDGLIIDDHSKVKGGRLYRLIEYATLHTGMDQEFCNALLMTHHSFTTSTELFDQLYKRYSIYPPQGLNQRLFELYVDKKIVPIRHK